MIKHEQLCEKMTRGLMSEVGVDVLVMKNLPSIIGHAYEEDHWLVVCPNCGHEMEFQGFFDSSDKYDCDICQTVFVCSRIVFDDDSYIS